MGVYDTSASGGGSCRRPFSWTEMYDVNEGLHLPVVFRASMNPYVLSRYLARAPFGQGWIISIDNMEDLLAGLYFKQDLNQYSCKVAHYNQAKSVYHTSFYMVR